MNDLDISSSPSSATPAPATQPLVPGLNEATSNMLPSALPQANPDNSAVVQSGLTGQSYASTIQQQANTPFGQSPTSALPSSSALSQPTSSTSPALPSLASPSTAAPYRTDAYGNDMTQADKYKSLADQLAKDRMGNQPPPQKPSPPPPSSSPSISLDFSGLPSGNFGDRTKRTQMLNGMLANAAKFGGAEGLNSAKLQMAQYLSANPDKAGRGMFGKNPFANGLI